MAKSSSMPPKLWPCPTPAFQALHTANRSPLPGTCPAQTSRHASQAGDHVQVAHSLSPGLSALPATWSSESLKTPSLSWVASSWERAFPGGRNLPSIRASSQWHQARPSPLYIPPFILLCYIIFLVLLGSFPTRRYCENWSMCRYICGRR